MEHETLEDVAADPPRPTDKGHNATRPRSALGHLGPARFEKTHRPAPVHPAA
jgi:hypothetical protein